MRNSEISILLLDDSPDLVRMYSHEIRRRSHYRVTVETDGHKARILAERQLFDVLVIDAKLDYRGVEFGGLRLADDLRPRYGSNAILLISRYITSDLMRARGSVFEFIEKASGNRTGEFCVSICRKIREMRRRQYVFVAMPYAKNLDDLYEKHLKRGIRRIGMRCVRADEVPHTRPIQEVIFELVEGSKLVVFVADQASGNAYYEAGFADAMKKELVIVSKSMSEVKFDIANRHTIIYGNCLDTLSTQIAKKIGGIRLNPPMGL